MKITTNNIPRELLHYWELTDKQRDHVCTEWDYMTEEEREQTEYFTYKGDLYNMSEFLCTGGLPRPMMEWEGYLSFGYVGGLVIKYPKMYPEWPDVPDIDHDHIIVGWY